MYKLRNMDETSFSKAINLLETNVPLNIATLKYLTTYRENSRVRVIGDKGGWAVFSFFPTSILSFDRKVYPNARTAVFVNGTSEKYIHQLFEELPEDSYVLRLNAPMDLKPLEKRFKIARGFAYNSYTCAVLPEKAPPVIVLPQSELTEEAIRLLEMNDHSRADLERYFSRGARWFGYIEEGKIKSLCFTYEDYGRFREIGGVRTQEEERRKGYAYAVVYAAIKYLMENKLAPRYVTEENNENSILLAKSLGMKRFLRIEHFLLNPVQ